MFNIHKQISLCTGLYNLHEALPCHARFTVPLSWHQLSKVWQFTPTSEAELGVALLYIQMINELFKTCGYYHFSASLLPNSNAVLNKLNDVFFIDSASDSALLFIARSLLK